MRFSVLAVLWFGFFGVALPDAVGDAGAMISETHALNALDSPIGKTEAPYLEKPSPSAVNDTSSPDTKDFVSGLHNGVDLKHLPQTLSDLALQPTDSEIETNASKFQPEPPPSIHKPPKNASDLNVMEDLTFKDQILPEMTTQLAVDNEKYPHFKHYPGITENIPKLTIPVGFSPTTLNDFIRQLIQNVTQKNPIRAPSVPDGPYLLTVPHTIRNAPSQEGAFDSTNISRIVEPELVSLNDTVTVAENKLSVIASSTQATNQSNSTNISHETQSIGSRGYLSPILPLNVTLRDRNEENIPRQVTHKRDVKTPENSTAVEAQSKPSRPETVKLDLQVEDESSKSESQGTQNFPPIPSISMFAPAKLFMNGLKSIKDFADSQFQTAQSAVQETAQNFGDFASNGFNVAQKTAEDTARVATEGMNIARDDVNKQGGNLGSLTYRQIETTGKALGQTVGNFGKLVSGAFGTASNDNSPVGMRWEQGGPIMRSLGGLFGGIAGGRGGGFLFPGPS
ncbi:uncharacterized protein LOC132706098 [Cylas formicarius]|uniref:uncharacterized protein LOC132706098 n=1 Tax=Cylas formicarius TaxID=197179 RepID=UPI0029586459|nr:uncharacterized protein LOC132706098 [Cylas formicarius]